MAARRNTGTSTPNHDCNDKDIEAYKSKRKRNNDAVKKARKKSKQTAIERKQNVDKLRISNKQLEAKIEEVKKSVEKLKEILLQSTKCEEQYEVIRQVISELSDEDGEDCKRIDYNVSDLPS